MNVKKLCAICTIFYCVAVGFSQTMESSSTIDWTNNHFDSEVNLNVEKANIPMPSGKSTAVNRITMQLPVLIKDPLLSLQVDSSSTLGDLVIKETLSLETLTRIIDSGKRTPGVFKKSPHILSTSHSIDLKAIGAELIKHRSISQPITPIQDISSRAWTGIVIDARGKFPVHGEYIESKVSPCFFPKVWDEDMTLIYEKNMMTPDIAKKQGIVTYDYSNNELRYRDRIGINPLRISAVQVYGANRTDPVISREDALRILTVNENRKLLEEGKCVILLDKDSLTHAVAAPEKTQKYYSDYKKLLEFLYVNKVPNVVAIDAPNGTRVSMQNLKFIADSSVLLPEEQPRLAKISQILKEVIDSGEYTILVEGHTADVNKPEGQMNLSIQRAKSIIQALAQEGLDTTQFSYKGHGGNMPIAPNDTDEGRAQNRRVEITILPKSTYIQKIW